MAQDLFSDRINAIFGQKLASLRKIRSLTQQELAQLLGVSRVTVANMERGKQNVQLAQVYSIAQRLDATPTDLLPTGSEIAQLHDGAEAPGDTFKNLARLRLRELLRSSQ